MVGPDRGAQIRAPQGTTVNRIRMPADRIAALGAGRWLLDHCRVGSNIRNGIRRDLFARVLRHFVSRRRLLCCGG